ncbi:MAG: CRTAC1 family protein [Sandaracinaceae bacterium]
MGRLFLARPLAPIACAVLALAGCDEGPCGSVTCAEGAVCVVSEADPTVAECRCGGVEGPACGVNDTCVLDLPCIPPPVCEPNPAWAPGMTAFRDATADWGLDALGVEGVRLTVTDIDGDGWADLEVRRGRLGAENFSGTSADRNTWLLHNDGHGHFEDVTESSGILAARTTAEGRASSVFAWGDVDNDGDLDAYVGLNSYDFAAVGEETSELMLNDGTGHFTLGSADSAVRRAGVIDNPAGASFFDVDHDGDLDLWVTQADVTNPAGSLILRSDVLFGGDGAGSFADVSADYGAVSVDWTDDDVLNMGLAHTRAWSANACDLNGDGFAELLSASYGRSPNHLWEMQDGHYVNRSVESGYAYDGDMTWQDNQFAECYCQANPTADGCDTVTGTPVIACSANWNHDSDREPWRLGGNSAATICADIDNDGDIDMMTGEIRHAWAGSGADGGELLINGGGAHPVFERPGDDVTGLTVEHAGVLWDEGHMTGAIFDFDNDGWQDVYIGGSDYPGNRGFLFRQASPLRFVEVPPGEGIDHNRSHGVVIADLDRDGDLDVIVGHSRARCDATGPNDCYPTSQVRVFENLAADGSNFIQLDLEGASGTNRSAIGARVTVTAGGVTQTQEVGGGHGHFGAQNDRVLHFGLGTACEAEVTIRWPNASLSTQTLTLPAGHRFHVVEGQGPATADPE